MKKTKRIVLVLSCLMGLSLAGCSALEAPSEPTPAPAPVDSPGVVAEANLVPAEKITLAFGIPGNIGEVLIEEGDVVRRGDPLARLDEAQSLEAQAASADLAVLEAAQNLDDLNENADLADAKAQLDLVQARQALVEAERAWDAVDRDAFREALDDARIELDAAEEDLETAKEDLADYNDLDEDHPTREAAEDDLEQAQQDYDEAQWAVEELENQYDLAEARLALAQTSLADAERRAEQTAEGPHPDALALAEASLSAAEAQLAAVEADREDATLAAPFDGRVLRLDIQAGQFAAPGTPAMVLADTSRWYLDTNDLTEDEVVRIDPDEPVSISFDALPGRTFSGEVESISDYFVEQFGDITYVVRIRLLDFDESLRWGMTAEVVFSE